MLSDRELRITYKTLLATYPLKLPPLGTDPEKNIRSGLLPKIDGESYFCLGDLSASESALKNKLEQRSREQEASYQNEAQGNRLLSSYVRFCIEQLLLDVKTKNSSGFSNHGGWVLTKVIFGTVPVLGLQIGPYVQSFRQSLAKELSQYLSESVENLLVKISTLVDSAEALPPIKELPVKTTQAMKNLWNARFLRRLAYRFFYWLQGFDFSEHQQQLKQHLINSSVQKIRETRVRQRLPSTQKSDEPPPKKTSRRQSLLDINKRSSSDTGQSNSALIETLKNDQASTPFYENQTEGKSVNPCITPSNP